MINNLRKFRVEKGWTIEQLSGYSGVSVSQISRIERGQSGFSPESQAALCQALGKTPAEMFMTTADHRALQAGREYLALPDATREVVDRIIHNEPQPAANSNK